ncbi:MAG TPA: type IV pilin protein [Pseudomonadales bacterium]
MNRQPVSQQGYTLLEVMIVVVIVGVIAAIAIPSYTGHLVDTRRTAAQASLLELANAIEQHRSQLGSYNGIDAGGGVPVVAIFPADKVNTDFYSLRITQSNATSYTLQATPVAGSPQAGDGSLRLLSTGERLWDKAGDNSFSASW